MTTVVAAPGRDRPAAEILLVTGIVLATLTEAIAGTVLSLGRGYISGDAHATPDESAWLDIGYTTLKLIGFIAAPWLMNRISPRGLIVGSTLIMGIACGIAAVTARLDLLIALRVIQGFAGGTLLVSGQAIIFLAYPRSQQPILQALFAMGSVVAPGTIAPALQGWLVDSQSWTWIFFSIVPVALTAAGLLMIADGPRRFPTVRRPFDWIGFALISVTFFCFTYVFSQGNRWRWFEEPHILWLTAIGAAALLAFLRQQVIANGRGLLDFTLFRSEDFCFAFIVSFVAGAALFGSAFLIPSFAVSVLAFRPTDAGLAPVAEWRAFRRRAAFGRLPHAGPPRSSGCHRAVWNLDYHGCNVDAIRLNQRKRRGRHDGRDSVARPGPRLPVSVDHIDRFWQSQ
jgi:MFS transporter, DHA2 family, multidrug resistance protein